MSVESDNSVKDVEFGYGKKYALSEEEIKKIVEISQRIEGYERASEEVKSRVQVLMKKHNVKVSI